MIRTYYFGTYSDPTQNQEYDIFDRDCASATDSVQNGFLSLHKIFHSMQRPVENKSGLEYSTAKIIEIDQVPIHRNRKVMIRT